MTKLLTNPERCSDSTFPRFRAWDLRQLQVVLLTGAIRAEGKLKNRDVVLVLELRLKEVLGMGDWPEC